MQICWGKSFFCSSFCMKFGFNTIHLCQKNKNGYCYVDESHTRLLFFWFVKVCVCSTIKRMWTTLPTLKSSTTLTDTVFAINTKDYLRVRNFVLEHLLFIFLVCICRWFIELYFETFHYANSFTLISLSGFLIGSLHLS